MPNDILQPQFKLWMSLFYNESGEPRILDYYKVILKESEYKIFRDNVLKIHTELIRLDMDLTKIGRLYQENFRLLFKLY